MGLRKDIFILILGYGRSGTSLCVGLLNSSLRINIGYEIDNNLIDSKSHRVRDMASSGYSGKHLSLSEKYNGNKIVVSSQTDLFSLKWAAENRCGIIHGAGELRVIFVKRNPIDTIVSKKSRVAIKGINLSVDQAVNDYLAGVKILHDMKLFFDNLKIKYYEFDFDNVLGDSLNLSKKLFGFIKEPFKDEFVLNYKGTHNYTHAVGVSRGNLIYGRSDKHLDLRDEIEVALSKVEIKEL